MTDDNEPDSLPDEPSSADFAAAEIEAEERETRRIPVAARWLRFAGVALVVLALILYVAVPVVTYVTRTFTEPGTGVQPAPLEPHRANPPKPV